MSGGEDSSVAAGQESQAAPPMGAQGAVSPQGAVPAQGPNYSTPGAFASAPKARVPPALVPASVKREEPSGGPSLEDAEAHERAAFLSIRTKKSRAAAARKKPAGAKDAAKTKSKACKSEKSERDDDSSDEVSCGDSSDSEPPMKAMKATKAMKAMKAVKQEKRIKVERSAKPKMSAKAVSTTGYNHLLKAVSFTKKEAVATTCKNMTSKFFHRVKGKVLASGGSKAVALAVGRKAFQKARASWVGLFPDEC